jgi:hypothetical protein
MATNYIQYTSRIKSSTADGVLLEADQIKDEVQGKLQSVINRENKTAIEAKANAADVYKKTETYTKSEVDTKVTQAVSTVYKPMGSKATIAEVIALTNAKIGDVWNVEAEFTLSGKKYPPSTNVVCVTATSTSAHTDANWDALGGTVDLTPYAKSADVNAQLGNKVDKVSGKALSTNDYTTAEKTKLAGIAAGAQVNTVTSVAGKTGAVALAKADVGLSNVDNTSDANKPVSTATQNALNAKANSADVYKKTETYSKSEVDEKVSSSISAVYKPKGSKDTIAQVIALTDAKPGDVWDVKAEFTLAGKKYPASTNVVCVTATTTSSHTEANWDALGGTVDLTPYVKSTDVNTLLSTKVDKVTGKGLSTNDYTAAEKTKLSRVPKYLFGAEGNPGQLLSVAPESNNIKLNFGGRDTTAGTSDSYPYTLPSATETNAGVMTAADKKKVDMLRVPNRYLAYLIALKPGLFGSDEIKQILTPIGQSDVVFPKVGDIISDTTDDIGVVHTSSATSVGNKTEYILAGSSGLFVATATLLYDPATDSWSCTNNKTIDLEALQNALSVS